MLKKASADIALPCYTESLRAARNHVGKRNNLGCMTATQRHMLRYLLLLLLLLLYCSGTLDQRLAQLREAYLFVSACDGVPPYRATKVAAIIAFGSSSAFVSLELLPAVDSLKDVHPFVMKLCLCHGRMQCQLCQGLRCLL